MKMIINRNRMNRLLKEYGMTLAECEDIVGFKLSRIERRQGDQGIHVFLFGFYNGKERMVNLDDVWHNIGKPIKHEE